MTKQEALAAIAANVKTVDRILAETRKIAQENEVPFYFYENINDDSYWESSSMDNWESSSC